MEPPESDSLCDRFVTGDSDLDMWIWILEYFAKFKTELWMVHDVFEMAPKLPDYLGEYTNEMVAFRCLVSLFDSSSPEHSQAVASDVNSKVEFDPSQSCEHVLQCILDEIPLSEMKQGEPELSKWNLQPFIKSKLLCLPKCALELIMESSSQEEDTEVLSCKGQETMRSDGKENDQEEDTEVLSCKGKETMRSDGKENDQVTPRTADPDLTGRTEDGQTICRSPGDGADRISGSNALLENRNEGFQNKSDGSHESSPSENRYRCVQCKESGKLLFCSSNGCEVMVHQKCLPSPPAYDDAGNFYCSHCAMTCSSAEYIQSQDEIAKAKKKLVSFLRLMSEVNKKKSIE